MEEVDVIYPALKVHHGAEGDQGLDAFHLGDTLVALLDHLRRPEQREEIQEDNRF